MKKSFILIGLGLSIFSTKMLSASSSSIIELAQFAANSGDTPLSNIEIEQLDFNSTVYRDVVLHNQTGSIVNMALVASVGGTCSANAIETFSTDLGFSIRHNDKFVNRFKLNNTNINKAAFLSLSTPEIARLTLSAPETSLPSLRSTSFYTNYVMYEQLYSYWYADNNQLHIHFYPTTTNLDVIQEDVNNLPDVEVFPSQALNIALSQ